MDLFFLMYAYGYPSSLFLLLLPLWRVCHLSCLSGREKEGSEEGRRRYESGGPPSRPPLFRRLVSVCIGWGGHSRWLFICFLFSCLLSCLLRCLPVLWWYETDPPTRGRCIRFFVCYNGIIILLPFSPSLTYIYRVSLHSTPALVVFGLLIRSLIPSR